MYSFEELIKDNPTLTGEQIYALHLKQKQDEEFDLNKGFEKHVEFINDLNNNGAYYKGKFGKQTFFYNITNIEFNKGIHTTCNLESITIFNNFTNKLTIIWDLDKFKDFSNLDVEFYERITVEEWNFVANLLEPDNLVEKLYNFKK